MADLHDRIRRLNPAIEDLMKVGGTPGLSLSVVCRDKLMHQSSHGFRDLELSLPVTADTIFPTCSLAKAVSAAAMGILIDDGLASWDTLVKDVVPSFAPKDQFLQDHTTLADLFSHRSGMSSCGNLTGGCADSVLVKPGDSMPIINDQKLRPQHLGRFAYNSLAYELCEHAIESLSGQTLDKFINSRILRPLGMRRTFLKTPPADVEDVATCYNALDDATPTPITSPKVGDVGYGSASGGLRSCARDLIKLYSAFVRSFNHQFETGQTSTPGSPIRQAAQMMSAKVPMFSTSKNEISYGFGWARAQLPNTLGHIGLNGRLMPHGMPIVGRGVPGQLVLYHQGTLPGALAVVLLLPETETIVLVLSNSLALTDVPDWVGQMVLQELLDVPEAERIDFARFARASIQINLEWESRISKGLAQGKPGGVKPPKDLDCYAGEYVDASGTFRIVVSTGCGKLHWAFQGLDSERYELQPYHGHIFTWFLPRNELSRRGRWVLGNDVDLDFWKVEFTTENAHIVSASWRHDPDLQPVVYKRC